MRNHKEIKLWKLGSLRRGQCGIGRAQLGFEQASGDIFLVAENGYVNLSKSTVYPTGSYVKDYYVEVIPKNWVIKLRDAKFGADYARAKAKAKRLQFREENAL